MIPQKNEIIHLLKLTIRNQVWVVKEEELAVAIEDVQVVDNNTVRLTAMVNGRLFYCERPFHPGTSEELRASVWKLVAGGCRQSRCPDHLLVEAVVAFNVHRELRKKPEELVRDLPLYARASFVPHRSNSYCASHDRAHYWGEQCPKCVPHPVSSKPKMQAA